MCALLGEKSKSGNVQTVLAIHKAIVAEKGHRENLQ